jgi:predicted transcriptional regulator
METINANFIFMEKEFHSKSVEGEDSLDYGAVSMYPLTKEEYVRLIDEALEEIKGGKFVSHEEAMSQLYARIKE